MSQATRILLVEDDVEEAVLVAEALEEIEEGRPRRPWIRRFELVHAEDLAEARGLLETHSFDVILLDLGLEEAGGLHPLLALRAAAPDSSVVVLVTAAEEALGASALREGAQDYLLREELDCAPLERALRHAIEAQRLRLALQRAAFVDDLTGLYNRRGFLSLGELHRKLAGKLEARMEVVLAGIEAGQDCDLVRIEAAEVLRETFRDSEVLGRLDGDRYAVLRLCPQRSPAPPVPECLRRRRNGPGSEVQLRLGAAELHPGETATIEELIARAERSMWENRPVGTSD